MKFNEIILSQVQAILQSCESIVIQMSKYQESDEKSQLCQCQDKFWWDSEDVNNKTFLNFQFDLCSSCEESETMSECFVNSPPSMERITMVSTPMESALVTAINQEMEDTPFSTPAHGSESEEDEEELSVADRVRNRHRRCVPHPVDEPDPVIVSVSPSVRTSTAGSSSDEEEINNNTTSGANTSFINNMLLCMNQVAPNAQFDSMKSL